SQNPLAYLVFLAFLLLVILGVLRPLRAVASCKERFFFLNCLNIIILVGFALIFLIPLIATASLSWDLVNFKSARCNVVHAPYWNLACGKATYSLLLRIFMKVAPL